MHELIQSPWLVVALCTASITAGVQFIARRWWLTALAASICACFMAAQVQLQPVSKPRPVKVITASDQLEA